MNEHLNEHELRELANRLDALAEADRTEAGTGFERGLLDAARENPGRPIPGRRRRRSTAWVPLAAAALVAVLAVSVWPTVSPSPTESIDPIAENDASTEADLWLASFDAMDAFFPDENGFDVRLGLIEDDLGESATDPTDLSDWLEFGESL